MKKKLQQIDDFFTALFGSVGKWIILGSFIITIILMIFFIVSVPANFEKIIHGVILVLFLIIFCMFIFKEFKKKS